MCERREDERTGEEARITMNSLGGVILRPVTLSFLLSLRTILPCDCDCVGMEEERRGEEERKERRERGEIYMYNRVNLHVHHSHTPHSPLMWLCQFPQLVSYQTLSSDVYEPVDVCVL